MKKGMGLRVYTIAYLAFLYAPIALLPIFAFNDSRIISFPLTGFTTAWFAEMWADEQMFAAMKNSFIVAIASSVLATIFGIFAARASTRYEFKVKSGLLGLILLPMVLPEMILAMALLAALAFMGVHLGISTIIMGHVLICTPFAVAILTSAFQSLDRSFEEAAYDLGETPASTFRLIILPLVMPGIISSLLICFTISLDEFIIAYFLGGNKTVLSVYIFGQFRFPTKAPAVMALGFVLVCVSVCLLILAEYFRRRGIAKTGGTASGGFV